MTNSDRSVVERAPSEAGTPAADSGKTAIRALLQGFSTEVLSRARGKIAAYRDLLPQGSTVYIAFLPATDAGEIVATAVALLAAGFNPVPHLTARGTAGRDVLDDYLG